MPLAIDASSRSDFLNTGVASITSGTITPPSGSQLWVFTGLDNGLGGFGVTISSSPSLTWTTVEVTSTSTTGPVAIAWANPGVGWSGTVTANWGTSIQLGVGIYVAVVTGAETTPGGDHNKHDPGSSWSRNSGTGITNCQVLATMNGSIALAVTVGTQATADWTVPSGQTSLASNYASGTWQFEAWRVNGTLTNGNTYTLNLNETHTEGGGMASVEIRPADGGGSARAGWGVVSI